MFKKTKLAAVTAAMLGMSAVAVSPVTAAEYSDLVLEGNGSTGQVLIFPYYNVNNGFSTAFNIINTKDEYKAVKVRFRESDTSNDVLDFNVYMSPYDVFTMTVTRDGNGAKVSTTDNTCTYPAIPAGGEPFRNVYDSVNDSDLREGYLEVIEMAVVTDSEVQAGILHEQPDGVPFDCGVIAEAWQNGGVFIQGGAASNTGDIDIVNPLVSGTSFSNQNIDSDPGWYGQNPGDLEGALDAPTGGLAGNSVLIDTVNVAGFVAEPTVIVNYSMYPQHYLSADQHFYLLPSLASGSNTSAGAVSTEHSMFVVAPWSTVARDWGLDDPNTAPNDSVPSGINPFPISYVMASTMVANQFFLGGDTSTDWVVSTPMRKHGIYNDFSYHPDPSGYDSDVDIAIAGDAGENGYWEYLELASADVSSEFTYFNREEGEAVTDPGDFSPPKQTESAEILFDREVNILALTATGSSNLSVLGSVNAENLKTDVGFENGWGKFDFSGYDMTDARYTDSWITMYPSSAYGVPLHGFGAARGVVNEQNVGETFPHIIERMRMSDAD